MSATITSQDQMGQALEQLGRLYHALAALRQRVEPANPRNFAVLAEGHIDEIRRLQRVLDEYAGAVAAEEQSAPLWLRVVGRDIEWQAEQRVENYEGDLREIDLDNCSFILRNAGMTPGEGLQLECQFPEELLEAAKEALDKRVQVTGSRAVEKGRRARPLVVNRIEILEDRAE